MMEPIILHEDNHLLVINKPAGWLSQGDETGDTSIVDWAKNYLRVKYNKPGNIFAGLPHRLDRPVSGIVIIAKTSKALERLTKMFREGEVNKTYWAMVIAAPPNMDGRLEHYLVKDKARNKVKTRKQGDKDAKKSLLRYKLLETVRDAFLLEVYPETGRPHQIRVQLAAIGCPIAGDVKYGGADKNRTGSIGLHGRSLKLIHPVTKVEVEFVAETEMNEIFNRLRR